MNIHTNLPQKGAVEPTKGVHMSKETIDEVFGVKEVFPEIADMELRYESACCSESQEKIYRDQNGKYYMVVEGTKFGLFSFYSTDAEQICVPITRATASAWSRQSLCGEEFGQALIEFGDADCCSCRPIWEYRHGTGAWQPDYIWECLMEMANGTYMLLSTDWSYPLCFENTVWADSDTDEYIYDVDVYHMTPEAAQRWAVKRGMDSGTCESVFGCTSES